MPLALLAILAAAALAQPPAFILGVTHSAGISSEQIRGAGFNTLADQFAAVDLTARFDEVFDPSSQSKLRSRIRAACQAARANPNFIGYSLTSAPEWDPAGVAAIRRLGPDHAAKQQYVDFLKDQYAYNIGRLNQAYGLDSPSFTDLAAFPFAGLDAARQAVRDDDHAFLGWIAEVLYRAAAEEHRRCDPNRRIFGNPPPPAAKFVDAVWIETSHDPSPHQTLAAAVDRAHQASGKPVIVSDHRPGDPAVEVAARPHVIGYLRCARWETWRDNRNLIRAIAGRR